MKYYSINEFSKILGVSAQTLRNWDNKGELHPHHTSSNGYRYYSHEQLNQVINIKQVESDNKLDEMFYNTVLTLSNLYYEDVSNEAKGLILKIKELIGGDDGDKVNKSNANTEQQAEI